MAETEILARELAELQRVVKKLVEDYYKDKWSGGVTITTSTNTTPTWESVARERQAKIDGLLVNVEDLEDRVGDLESQLADSELERDDLLGQNDLLASELDQARDLIKEMKGILK